MAEKCLEKGKEELNKVDLKRSWEKRVCRSYKRKEESLEERKIAGLEKALKIGESRPNNVFEITIYLQWKFRLIVSVDFEKFNERIIGAEGFEQLYRWSGWR
jgi:hypothetical protein